MRKFAEKTRNKELSLYALGPANKTATSQGTRKQNQLKIYKIESGLQSYSYCRGPIGSAKACRGSLQRAKKPH